MIDADLRDSGKLSEKYANTASTMAVKSAE